MSLVVAESSGPASMACRVDGVFGGPSQTSAPWARHRDRRTKTQKPTGRRKTRRRRPVGEVRDVRDGRVVGAGQVRAARGRDDDDARRLVRAALQVGPEAGPVRGELDGLALGLEGQAPGGALAGAAIALVHGHDVAAADVERDADGGVAPDVQPALRGGSRPSLRICGGTRGFGKEGTKQTNDSRKGHRKKTAAAAPP